MVSMTWPPRKTFMKSLEIDEKDLVYSIPLISNEKLSDKSKRDEEDISK